MKTILFLLATFIALSSCSAANTPSKKILLVVAMQEEAEPIIRKLHLTPKRSPDPRLPMKIYRGKQGQAEIELVLNGIDPVYDAENIGTQPAVLSTYLGITHFNPDIIISVGTAGGRPEFNVQLGHIYLSKKIYFYRRQFHSPQYKLYGAGGYESMPSDNLLKVAKVHQGIVCSGDIFDETAEDRKIMLEQQCEIIDMEAAGVAWVAMLARKPMFSLKGVTNYVGHAGAHEEFLKHHVAVTNALAGKLRIIIDEVSSASTTLNPGV